MEQFSIIDHNVNYFALLLDVTPEEFRKAMAETGMSGEDIIKKYFEELL